MSSGNCLIVMTKHPVAGEVKTRLAATIGASEAAELYEAMLQDTIVLAGELEDTRLFVSFTPAAARPYYERLAPAAGLIEQPEGDLGVRLRHAFDEAFALGYASAVVIGSDSPHLTPEDLNAAYAAAARDGACIGPCEDGGYYLLGLSRRAPALFEGIDWGSERVLEQTLARAAATGLALAELEVQFDIDTAEDLRKLETLLETTAPDRLAHTRRALSALDLQRALPL